MLFVNAYKWLLVSFQCEFLSIKEVVELFHSPYGSKCLSLQILVILFSLCKISRSITNHFHLLDKACMKSLLGSIHLQGCFCIYIKVWKSLHVGNFHLQSDKVLKMHFTWLIVHGLMCECTEGCCKVCTE